MKKIFFLFVLCVLALPALARTVDVSAIYTGASAFNQVQASATFAPTLNLLTGIEAKFVKEKAFKDPIYMVALPMSLNLEMLRFHVRPFYYFKNKSDVPGLQDASAFGINGQVRLMMRNDEINDIYTYAFLGAAFARQKGTVFYDNDPAENRYYSQAAYQVGFSQTLFNAFGFDVIGTAFQYPDGIKGVSGLRSIMNQQELGYTQTFDIVHHLAKYTVGARLTRLWIENSSSLYAGYRYGEYHDAQAEHSFMVGNSFTISHRVAVDVAYNHVRTIHNKDKRDIFYIQLETSF